MVPESQLYLHIDSIDSVSSSQPIRIIIGTVIHEIGAIYSRFTKLGCHLVPSTVCSLQIDLESLQGIGSSDKVIQCLGSTLQVSVF